MIKPDKDAIRTLEEWLFPACEWETLVVSALDRLPASEVVRASANLIQSWGTVQNQCHQNANMVARLLGDDCHVVSGWWKAEQFGMEAYMLHSVISIHGRLICVSPGTPDRFLIVVDPELERRSDGFYRDGHLIEDGVVRRDPDSFIEKMKKEIERQKSMLSST